MAEIVTFYIHIPFLIKNVPVCPGCPVFSTLEKAPFKLLFHLHKSLKNTLKIGKKKSHFTYPSKDTIKKIMPNQQGYVHSFLSLETYYL